jgi:hypothetical protein
VLSVEVFMMGPTTWVGGYSDGSPGLLVSTVVGRGSTDLCS